MTLRLTEQQLQAMQGNAPGTHLRTVKRKPQGHEEEDICIAFTKDLNDLKLAGQWGNLISFCHVPNGGKRGKREAGRLKAMGVQAGHPDYMFVYNAWPKIGGIPTQEITVAYIEMKTPKAGKRLKDAQEEFRALCDDYGIPHAVCISAGEAMEQLREWGIVEV